MCWHVLLAEGGEAWVVAARHNMRHLLLVLHTSTRPAVLYALHDVAAYIAII
jgi:hypothetical protein